jgi:hypothetical protein
MKKIVIAVSLLFLCLSVNAQENNKDIEDYPIPKNLEQCFKVLDKTMAEREKFLIKTLPEDSLYYNDEIRHKIDIVFWLDEKSRLTKYFNKIGLDAFGRQYSHYETILVSYHRYLNNKEINLAEQIENYNNHWQQESLEYQQKRDSIQRQYLLNKMITSSINSYIENHKNLVRQGYGLKDTIHYYICWDGLPADFPYRSVQQNGTFFSLYNLSSLPGYFKRTLKKGIKTLFVGINLSNNQFVITIAGRGVKLVGKEYIHITIGDWGIFTYEYSCEKQKWELKESRYGGV